jgi:hypothetical protein
MARLAGERGADEGLSETDRRVDVVHARTQAELPLIFLRPSCLGLIFLRPSLV